MINSFQEVTTYSEEGFYDHLGKVSLYHIFEPIFKEYVDMILCAKIVKFIVFANSIESDKIRIGGDRRKDLHKIFKDLDIPNEMPDPSLPRVKRNLYDEIVLLSNVAVIESLQLWLRHKDNRQLEFLFTLQNAYVQQQAAALKDIRKSTGEVDYDQKYKCIGYMMNLKQQIKDAESELQQNDPKLREAYEEVKAASKKTNTIGVEKFSY